MNYDDWGRGFIEEGLDLMVGTKLGNGIDRQVHVYLGNDQWVIKIEADVTMRFQNTAEWLLWQEVRGTKELARWLAPCIRISSSGGYLIQERTYPVIQRDLHKQIPAWLTDLKRSNWGRLENGRVVCHDYGLHLATERGLGKRLHKARWTT